MLKLKVKRWHPEAKLPTVAHPGEDFGYDVFACLPTEGFPNNTLLIQPGEQRLVPIELSMEVEQWQIKSYPYWIPCGLIAKQPSGLALKRMLDVKAGVIDAGYRNEIKILLYNYGEEPQTIKHHDKIAQLVPVPVFTGDVEEVQELTESDRGTAGWGSGHVSK